MPQIDPAIVRRLDRLAADPAWIEDTRPLDLETTMRRLLAVRKQRIPAPRRHRVRDAALLATLLALAAFGMYAVTQFAQAVHRVAEARGQIWR